MATTTNRPWYTYPDLNNYKATYSFSPYPVEGTDIPMPQGTPITSMWPGTVARLYYDNSGGVLIIAADNPTQPGANYYYFAHLDTIDPTLKIGSHIGPNQFIGTSGGQLTGGTHPASPQTSSGPHIMLGLSNSPSISPSLASLPDSLNPHRLLSSANAQKSTGDCCKTVDCQVCAAFGNRDWCCGQEWINGAITPLPQTISDTAQAVGNISDWLSNPLRIIKLIFGVLLIGVAVFFLASPQGQLVQAINKMSKDFSKQAGLSRLKGKAK